MRGHPHYKRRKHQSCMIDCSSPCMITNYTAELSNQQKMSNTLELIFLMTYHDLPCRTILNLFQFFLKLVRMGVPDRASILQDWTHHTFISCFLHILGAGEKSSPQETKCSIGFSANIADMRNSISNHL